jgi:hypothetical protein
MKSKHYVKVFAIKEMSLKLFMVIILILPEVMVHSQEASAKLRVYPSFGIGIGFFYPQDVNQYIKDEIVSRYGTSYNTDLYMYLEVKGGITFRLKHVDFNGMLEYDIAPKFAIVTGGDNISYNYSKISPEVSANYYFPSKSARHSFFIGGGVNYNFMKFEKYSASSPGIKMQFGYNMQLHKLNLQPYLAFKYIKAKDTSNIVDFDLDYTGGQIGVIISIHS